MPALLRRIAYAIAPVNCVSLHALLASISLVSSVHGQPSDLSLEDAVELAVREAPQLKAQVSALDAAHSRAVTSGRLPDPELIVGVDNLPVTTDEAWSVTRDFMTMRKVGVMQTFPNGRKRTAERQIAQADIAVVRARTQQTQLEIARLVAEAWVDAYVAEALRANLNLLRPELELQAQAANAALRAGRGSSVDALAAQSAIFELDDRLLDAQREVRSARTMLARWIGAESATFKLSGAPAFDILPSAPERVLATLHQHVTLLTYQAQIELAESEVDRARADKRPDWSAELTYGERGSAFSDMVSLQFRIGLPLFRAHRQDPAISAKRAELARLEAEREAELRMHAEEVASMLSTWESARDRLALFQRERLPLARERTKAALASYRAGALALAEVMSSVVSEVEVQRSYSELIREIGRAWVFLRYLEPQGDAA